MWECMDGKWVSNIFDEFFDNFVVDYEKNDSGKWVSNIFDNLCFVV